MSALAIMLAGPGSVSAFGFAADMQCTNPQYDYSCQKGSRCASRKQGGKGTECVDSDSGVPGVCMSFKVCKATQTADGKPLHQFKPDDLQGWSGLGEGASPFGMGDAPFDAASLAQLSSPEMTNDLSGMFGDGPNPFPDTPFAGPDTNTLDSGDFSQREGTAATQATPGFGQSASDAPFGDVPAPLATPAADAAQAAQGPFGDQAALSPSHEGQQQGAEQGGGGQQGGMPQLPQMGSKGKGGGQSGQQSGQPQTGFGQQQNPQDKKPIQQAQDQNLLQRFWDWLSGKTATT